MMTAQAMINGGNRQKEKSFPIELRFLIAPVIARWLGFVFEHGFLEIMAINLGPYTPGGIVATESGTGGVKAGQKEIAPDVRSITRAESNRFGSVGLKVSTLNLSG